MPGLNEQFKWTGFFDDAKVQIALPALLSTHVPGFGPEAIGDTLRMVRRLANDSQVTDVRAMAYILATVAWESKKIKQYHVPKLTAAGAPVLHPKTQQPVVRHPKLWTVFQASEEAGLGGKRDYRNAVKVAVDGTGALVTERDGEQFQVAADGSFGRASGTAATAKPGSTFGMAAHPTYVSAAGTEHAYHGRGLVQLTWWNGYASASIAIGQGLALLLSPEKLLDFDISYQVLTVGMLKGKSFANGHKCSDYFTDTHTHYAAARAMVNANDPQTGIVKMAQAFEALLLNARLSPPGP